MGSSCSKTDPESSASLDRSKRVLSEDMAFGARNAYYGLVKHVFNSTGTTLAALDSSNLTNEGYDDVLDGYFKSLALKDIRYGMMASKPGH